jgi:transposase
MMNRELINLPDLHIKALTANNNNVTITAQSRAAAAACPQCGVISHRIHSYYWRKSKDLPISGQRTIIRVEARRFRCINGECCKRTFVERLACLPLKAQRTARLGTVLQTIAFGLGGEAGCRLATQLQMPVSADTLLHLIRHWSPPQPPAARIIGVDDWALRKRVSYGTILVDLETHRPIELLEERTSTVLKAWLIEQKGIEVIARDRSSEYALGAKEGASQAVQVADRFHLLQNLKQMLDRLLTNKYQQVRPLLMAAQNTQKEAPKRLLTSIRDTSVHEKAVSQASRERRLETYQQIKQLQSTGWNIGQIARRLDINPTTVRKYFYAEAFPERNRRLAAKSILNPHLAYLEFRFQKGCQNATQLWREIKEKGYPGSCAQVFKWVRRRRQQEYLPEESKADSIPSKNDYPFAPPPPVMSELPSARQLTWMMIRQPGQLKQEEREVLLRLQQDAQMEQVYTLAQQFIQLVKRREAAKLNQWLQECKAGGIAMLQSFAARIEQDYAAVRAALETEWSNGQTEGQINRLKLIKRQMYGRANFDLLRKRVLYTA